MKAPWFFGALFDRPRKPRKDAASIDGRAPRVAEQGAEPQKPVAFAMVVDADPAPPHDRVAMPPFQAAPSRPTSWSSAVFDIIEWRRFEAMVETLFQQAGFATISTRGANGSSGFRLYSAEHPKPVGLVQALHRDSAVSVDQLRELREFMVTEEIRRGQLVTTSLFTEEAIAFARPNGIDLFDRWSVLEMASKRSAQQQQALLDAALQGEFWRPSCLTCGLKMVERIAGNGRQPIWACAHGRPFWID